MKSGSIGTVRIVTNRLPAMGCANRRASAQKRRASLAGKPPGKRSYLPLNGPA
ncbi:MAG: hypothetical protein GY792_33640 [Gammaproteobacteria bacterium]|nr:hypothetical protein [Gammaproteobacteria bacterium]